MQKKNQTKIYHRLSCEMWKTAQTKILQSIKHIYFYLLQWILEPLDSKEKFNIKAMFITV